MIKIIIILSLILGIATPSFALNFFDRIKCKEVNISGEKVLVNRLTGKVEQRLIGEKYEPIPSDKGFGGIPSVQDMYQARYDRMKK